MEQVRGLLVRLIVCERHIQHCKDALDYSLEKIAGIEKDLDATESEVIRISQIFAVARKDSSACLDQLKNSRVRDLDSVTEELTSSNRRSMELYDQLELVLLEYRRLKYNYWIYQYYTLVVSRYLTTCVTIFYLARQQLEPYQSVTVETLAEERFVKKFTNMTTERDPELDVIQFAHAVRIAHGLVYPL